MYSGTGQPARWITLAILERRGGERSTPGLGQVIHFFCGEQQTKQTGWFVVGLFFCGDFFTKREIKPLLIQTYYLRNKGLSSSVKKVTAFPLCPALPVRPAKHTFCRVEILLLLLFFLTAPASSPAQLCPKNLNKVQRVLTKTKASTLKTSEMGKRRWFVSHASPILWMYSTALVGKS